jgi:hypothetical protein
LRNPVIDEPTSGDGKQLRPVPLEDEPVRGLDSFGVVLEVLLGFAHLDSEEEEDERTTKAIDAGKVVRELALRRGKE